MSVGVVCCCEWDFAAAGAATSAAMATAESAALRYVLMINLFHNF
jgi:hypothetical protein